MVTGTLVIKSPISYKKVFEYYCRTILICDSLTMQHDVLDILEKFLKDNKSIFIMNLRKTDNYKQIAIKLINIILIPIHSL